MNQDNFKEQCRLPVSGQHVTRLDTLLDSPLQSYSHVVLLRLRHLVAFSDLFAFLLTICFDDSLKVY